LAAAAAPEAPKAAAPAPAAAPADPPISRTRAGYRIRRLILNGVAALTGAVYSLPVAGPSLSRSLVARASGKRVVLSDYDDTLAHYNQVLPEDMVRAIADVKAAGKDFVVISDRGDEKRAHQLTVFESLASLPPSVRAGMYAAANSGGRVYRYDENGEPVRVFEAPALDAASKEKVAAAAAATKARLAELGAEQHVPSAANNNPSESWGTYGYAMMLKVGSDERQVRGAAAILQQELRARGLDVEVSPRFAKDPANPPYINFSIVTKKTSAAWIAKALKATAGEILILGDNAYAPVEAKRLAGLARLGRLAAGRALPKTGNATDRNMERAVPGALTLSVGGTADPAMSDGWALRGGPETTLEVLRAVAARPNRPAPPSSRAETAIQAVMIAAVLAAAGGAYYAFFHALAEIFRQGETLLHGPARDVFAGGLPLAAALGTLRASGAAGPSLKDSISPEWAAAGSPAAYAEALGAARGLAAAAGYSPDALFFTDSRPSGASAWTYYFVSPRVDEVTGPREYAVTVAAAAGGLAVAQAKDLGGKRLFVGVPASAARTAAAVGPATVAAAAGPEARSLSLEARWPKAEGPAKLWYVVRGERGRELYAVDAAGGETVKPAPYAWVKPFLIWLGLAAATIGIYGAIAFAFSHSPASSGSYVSSGTDIGRIFGGALGAGLLAGSLAKAAPRPAAPTDDEIRAAASSVSSYKGMPWSQTEYNVGYYTTLERLKERGASDAQLELYKRLCAEAPLRGGRFNPWSGD
ncbi:MAG: hypothetical protein KGM24_04735, partial [Elusimicrobia bacterium]|nr:hypothetical protein [Elusimicrobiota bacterium]